MKLSEFTQRLGEALDYGVVGPNGERVERKLVLAEWVDAGCWKCYGTGLDEDDDACERCDGTGKNPDGEKTLVSARGSINEQLAILMGVDYKKLMTEKDQMLEELRKANA